VDFRKFTPVVINQSAFDLRVDLDIQITGDSVVKETYEDAREDITEDPSLYIGMTVSKNYVNDLSANADTFKGFLKLALDDEEQRVSFILDKEPPLVRNIDGTFEYAKNPEAKGYGTQLKFDGACNPNGDWKNFVKESSMPVPDPEKKTVGITAVFSFDKAGPGPHIFENEELAYGLLKNEDLDWDQVGDDDLNDTEVGFMGVPDEREITLTVVKGDIVLSRSTSVIIQDSVLTLYRATQT